MLRRSAFFKSTQSRYTATRAQAKLSYLPHLKERILPNDQRSRLELKYADNPSLSGEKRAIFDKAQKEVHARLDQELATNQFAQYLLPAIENLIKEKKLTLTQSDPEGDTQLLPEGSAGYFFPSPSNPSLGTLLLEHYPNTYNKIATFRFQRTADSPLDCFIEIILHESTHAAGYLYGQPLTLSADEIERTNYLLTENRTASILFKDRERHIDSLLNYDYQTSPQLIRFNQAVLQDIKNLRHVDNDIARELYNIILGDFFLNIEDWCFHEELRARLVGLTAHQRYNSSVIKHYLPHASAEILAFLTMALNNETTLEVAQSVRAKL